jgi:flavodoxin I
MSVVKVIYGSSTGNTENAANAIAGQLGGVAVNVASASLEDLHADVLVLGTSTWGIGDLQDDWLGQIDQLDKVDLKGKKVALFGLGDQGGFGDSFIDGVGTLYQKAVARGAEVIGIWSTDGYSYSNSTAVINGKFVGLALDDDTESGKTPERIAKWCAQVKAEAGL